MTDKEQQAEFIYEIGLWLGPVIEVARNPQNYDSTALRTRRARFQKNFETLSDRLNAFCAKVMGVSGSVEWHDIQGPLAHIYNSVRDRLHQPTLLPELEKSMEQHRHNLLANLAALPAGNSVMTFDANTPYSTYLRLKDLFDTVAAEIVYADRYVDASLFYRYLRRVDPAVKVTVVTWPRVLADNEFLDASRMFATERGSQLYRLLDEPTFHARLLQLDQQVMLLDGSIKHAGHNSPSMITTLPAGAASLQQVQDVVTKAKEVFGPSQTAHP